MTTIYVAIDIAGEPVHAGTLYTHQRGQAQSATFTYDPTYLADPRSYALDPLLPLGAGQFHTPPGRSLFGTFADSTPDRWGRRLVTRAQRAASPSGGASFLSEADYLLGIRDDMRQGALRLQTEPAGEWKAPKSVSIPTVTNLPYLLDLATRSLAGDVTVDEIQLLVDSGSGLGGARPKVHVELGDGALAIAKFPSEDTDTWSVGAWEAVALDVAAAAGVPCAAIQLISVADRAVLLSTRFDRRRGGERVGYWSAMTAMEASDGDTGSYLEIADFVAANSPNPSGDLAILWRRALVDVLLHNTDNHLRNHGFLREANGWAVSPAFDINPNPDAGAFATELGATGGGDLTVDGLIGTAEFFGLGSGDARRELALVVAAVDQWRAIAERRGLRRAEVSAMASAFEHAESERAHQLID